MHLSSASEMQQQVIFTGIARSCGHIGHSMDDTGGRKYVRRDQTNPGVLAMSGRRGSVTRLISGVWTVNSPQSHIVRVYDAGHGKSGVFHSAEWHDGDWSSDGIREAWLWFFIWVESFKNCYGSDTFFNHATSAIKRDDVVIIPILFFMECS
ncbi:hypothetical protein TNCV_2990581 [Trichonephila clavipes]|nr:hypothetical protein TNCV_2990581 [Trichonephila clavipes]